MTHEQQITYKFSEELLKWEKEKSLIAIGVLFHLVLGKHTNNKHTIIDRRIDITNIINKYTQEHTNEHT